MARAPVLRIYLDPPTLKGARAGGQNFPRLVMAAVQSRGWRAELRESGDAERLAARLRGGYALFHMESPTHERALTYRRSYIYPFWRIEKRAERWLWPVAQARFDAESVDPGPARDFVARTRARVWPDARLPARRADWIYVPLQGILTRQRSFQTASPLTMLERVAQTFPNREIRASLHPREVYTAADLFALEALTGHHKNLTVGPLNPDRALSECAFVVTENSAVAFQGYFYHCPAVLFAGADFHHIALGPDRLTEAPDHRPDYDRYLWWFLRENAINAGAPGVEDAILEAMKKGGWPL
ncbi:hypothetical protein [Paracoccus pacificus]|uniref:Capsule polysaccharide biosynthesis protein n=1 Tax=Paracoccus pacificus TaxID=1463598 RepID=A0ABW4R3G3_9RHOB